MYEELPASFYRAEARWLEPPDEPDDLSGDIHQLLALIEEKLEAFFGSYCGEITEKTDISRIIAASEQLTIELKNASDEIGRLEDEREDAEPGYDEYAAYEAWRDEQQYGVNDP